VLNIKVMTEKIKSIIDIKIPIWAFSIIVPVMVAFIGFTVNANARATASQTKIEVIEKTLDTKADKKDIDYIIKMLDDNKESLDRIENNLTKHMEGNKK
jgi:hypothetical protein